MLAYLICTLLALFLSAVFSGLEIALYSVSRPRLARDLRAGVPAAARAEKLLADIPLCLSTLLICNNVANNAGTQFFACFLADARVGDVELWTSAVLVPVFFFFGETLPKQIVLLQANRVLQALSSVFRMLELVFWPLSWLLSIFTRLLNLFLRFCGLRRRGGGGRKELSDALESLMIEGKLSPEQVAFSGKVMELEDREAGEVMQELSEVCQVREDLPAYEAGRAILAKGLKRALLIDASGRFTGRMMSLNSVLRNPETGACTAGECSRPVPVLDIGTEVTVALTRMRRADAPLALVRRRPGEIVGALTINRLVSTMISGVDNRKWNM